MLYNYFGDVYLNWVASVIIMGKSYWLGPFYPFVRVNWLALFALSAYNWINGLCFHCFVSRRLACYSCICSLSLHLLVMFVLIDCHYVLSGCVSTTCLGLSYLLKVSELCILFVVQWNDTCCID